MHGSTARVESTDAGGESDTLLRWRNALSAFNAAAKAAAEVGEHQLQRLAEDATARARSFVLIEEEQQALQQRRVDGQNPEAPREEA